LTKKIKDGRDIRGVEKLIFQKSLISFAVQSTNFAEERFGKYSKMAAQYKMADFRLFVFKKIA
jgi:hypothetical protein